MLSLKQNTKAVWNAKSVQPGFINKGNSILQIFSVITHPLEQTLFGIKHFITYVKSYPSPHASKKALN